jgi:hypothetical protein
MEFPEESVNIFVGLKNGLEIQIFPKFITISQFTIQKALFVVVLQGVKINIPVVCKIVCKAVVTAVAIAEQYKFGSIVKGNDFGILIRPVEPLLGRHAFNFA